MVTSVRWLATIPPCPKPGRQQATSTNLGAKVPEMTPLGEHDVGSLMLEGIGGLLEARGPRLVGGGGGTLEKGTPIPAFSWIALTVELEVASGDEERVAAGSPPSSATTSAKS
jgi:hypothetical protein